MAWAVGVDGTVTAVSYSHAASPVGAAASVGVTFRVTLQVHGCVDS